MNSQKILKLIINNLMDIIPEIEHELITSSSKLCLLGQCCAGRADLIEKLTEEAELKAERSEFYSESNLGEWIEMLFPGIPVKSS